MAPRRNQIAKMPRGGVLVLKTRERERADMRRDERGRERKNAAVFARLQFQCVVTTEKERKIK